jgi:hypothetical protein
MKMTDAQAKTLVEVLNAQSGVARIADKEAYTAKLAEVKDFLNVDAEGKPSGGIKKEAYEGASKEVKEAAKAHSDKAKARAEKAAEKAAKGPAKPKLRTPEEEQETAVALVSYMQAVSGQKRVTKEVDGKEIDDPEGFRHVANKSRKYIDHKKGGLLNTAPEGKTSPWDRFKGFPGVKEAAKAHQAHLKAKGKDAPAMS